MRQPSAKPPRRGMRIAPASGLPMFRVHPTDDPQMNPNRDFAARAIRGVAPVFAALALAATPVRGQAASAPDSLPPAVRVAADPAHGFSSPYYLYAPPALRADSARGRTRTILVLPNNTGIVDDDPAVHEARVRELAGLFRRTAGREGVILLMPAFPRPRSRDGVYTHALDRDAMLAPEPALRRPDLQLAAMIDDARRRLASDGIAAEPRVLMHGHSAAGMFVSRFVMLHPERLKAASIGAPGGWPMAPVASYHGQALTYPAGVADMRAVSGHAFDRAKAAEVPLFLFLGSDDTNDSVPYNDSYDVRERAEVLRFGATPVARWPAAEALYRPILPRAVFRTYPGVAHDITPAMWRDIWRFFQPYIAR